MLSALIDTVVALDKLIVSYKIRQSHLSKHGRKDYMVASAIDSLEKAKSEILYNVNKLVKQHPAYPWLSKVKGVGIENIAKVLSSIRVIPEFRCVDCGNVQQVNEPCTLCGRETKPLDYADTISSLWRYAGYAVFPDGSTQKRRAGSKLDYNSELKTMCWRLGISILKAGLRKKCSVCGELLGEQKLESHSCKDAMFTTVAVSRYAQYYLDAKNDEYEKAERNGIPVLPTPDKAVCSQCGAEIQLKTSRRCQVCGGKGYKVKDDSALYEGRIHNRALRKMIKLFLAHLWTVWRTNLGFEVSKPYAVDKLNMNYIDPWLMIDR